MFFQISVDKNYALALQVANIGIYYRLAFIIINNWQIR